MISDRTRKLLWGRSGSRCAICKCELATDRSSLDRESVVGDECHIVSGEEGGPRFDADFPRELLDLPENLLLLCRVHHKQVDDQKDTFTANVLREVKVKHEDWVRNALSAAGKPLADDPIRFESTEEGTPECLPRLRKGSEVFAVVDGACASHFANDELTSEAEVDLVGGFLELIRDWGDLGPDLGPAERTRVGFDLSARLKELDEAGFWVFGGREIQMMKGGGSPACPWSVAVVRVYRKTNPCIVVVSESEAAAFLSPLRSE